jgi:Lar family restriction alleviation protein
MSEELKPCPFCGGEMQIYDSPLNDTVSESYRVYMPQCKNDNCIAGDDGYYGKSPEDAIKAWNRRAKSD